MARKAIKKTSGRASKMLSDQMYGAEPVFTGPVVDADIGKSYNWYNLIVDKDTLKSYLVAYLKAQKSPLVKSLAGVPSWECRTLGATARMMSNGAIFPADYVERFNAKIEDLVKKYEGDSEIVAPVRIMPNIQKRMNDKVSEVIASLEAEIDAVFANGQTEFEPNVWIGKTDLKPLLLSRIVTYYTPLAQELKEALDGGDAQLKEAYRIYKKATLKRALALVEAIIAACSGSARALRQVAKINRRKPVVKGKTKPRKKVSAAKSGAALKFKAEEPALGVKSIDPKAIIGASQVWLYNTRYRKLTVINAATEAGLAINGTSITGYGDMTAKRLRKPSETLPKLLAAGKVALRSFMDDIKTTPRKVTNRTNEEVIILRAVR